MSKIMVTAERAPLIGGGKGGGIVDMPCGKETAMGEVGAAVGEATGAESGPAGEMFGEVPGEAQA